MGFPGGSEVKASTRNAGDLGSIPGESHGQRSLVGYSPRVSKTESDMTERLPFHFHCVLTNVFAAPVQR